MPSQLPKAQTHLTSPFVAYIHMYITLTFMLPTQMSSLIPQARKHRITAAADSLAKGLLSLCHVMLFNSIIKWELSIFCLESVISDEFDRVTGAAGRSEGCRAGVQRTRAADEDGRSVDIPRRTQRVSNSSCRTRRAHQTTGRSRQTPGRQT